jgi:hypothetical protein
VRTLIDGRPLGPGEHRIRWNLRDERGRLVPVGAYRLRLVVRGGAAVRSVIVIRSRTGGVASPGSDVCASFIVVSGIAAPA